MVVLLYKVYIVEQEECACVSADVLEAAAELVGGLYMDANTILLKSSTTPKEVRPEAYYPH